MARRMYPGVSGPRPDKKVARQELEAKRLEWWRSLSPAKQLSELDRRLGKNIGARKQRARLLLLCNRKKVNPVKQDTKHPNRMKAKERRQMDRLRER